MDPASAAGMAQSGIAAIGKILGGIGSFKAAKARSRALEASARQARAEAGVAAQIALEEGDRAAARAAVNAAASGGGLTGSAMGALDDLASSAMFNARSALYAGTVEGRNLDYEAKTTRRQGELALVTSFMGAASDGASALGTMRAAQIRRREAAGAPRSRATVY